tara:strand:- start:85 stop:525 length:441 start_codon:yes stop_codon:yes gene_type:complete
METLLQISEFREDELGDVVSKISDFLPSSGIVAIQGDMGVGKTTLVKFLSAHLGIEDEVSSPTFGIINVYKGKGQQINHIDLYRLKDAEEVESAGVFEIFHGPGLSLVEWPEKIADELEGDVWVLKIELCEKFNHEGGRRLILQRP